MEQFNLKAFKDMSPFEVKDIFIEEAMRSHKEHVSKGGKKRFLNAGRGNPNFLNTTVRLAFSQLSHFASTLSDKLLEEKGLGIEPQAEGIAKKFNEYLDNLKEGEEVKFLKNAIQYAIDTFSFDPDSFIFEIVDAALGDFYPTPPRIYPQTAKIVRAYLEEVLYLDEKTRRRKFDLFATEGATAAMVYIFYSMKVNKILKKNDEIAILTPIFTPYLEIPHLSEYHFKEIWVESSEDNEWQVPDEELEKLKDPKVKALFLVNPTNPTSVALEKKTIEKIANIIKKDRQDLIVITDTVYATFVDDFHSIINEIPENTICVYSYSKYFGVTGWRLGVILLDQNHVIDRLIANLPEEDLKEVCERYKTVTPEPKNFKFIDRLESDSRDEALAHTGGLSGPQQAFMCLCSLFNLIDKEKIYKKMIHEILKQRMKNLYDNLEIPMFKEASHTYYYALLDFSVIAKQKYGEEFAEHLEKNVHILEFLYRLAKEKYTICLHGEGFHGPAWSIRVSLANLETEAYIEVGKNLKELLKEYYDDWKKNYGLREKRWAG